jgi:ABC-2 type transport system permease protein
VPTSALVRTLVVAAVTFRSAFFRGRGLTLLLAATVYPVVVLGISATGFSGLDLLATAETLFSTLYLPVVLLLVCLVLGVAAFRGELEEDTLVYPLGRTVPRPALAVGKYLGFVGAAVAVLLPSSIIGTAVAAGLGHGPTTSSAGLGQAVLVLPVLGVVAYGAIFLLLGLVTRQALVIGLLYGFLWETFLSLIAGPIRELTVIYYLRGVGAWLVPGGSLGAGVAALDPAGVAIAAGLLAIGSLAAASLFLRYAEIRPAAAPA